MNKKITSWIVFFFWLSATPVLASEGAADHGFDVVEFIARIVNTVLFFGVLYYFLKEPVKGFFSNRLSDIKASLDLAEHSREEAKTRLGEIDAKLASLDQELEEIEKQARKEAEKEKERINQQAKSEAEHIMAQAKAEIDNIKRQAIGDLKKYVTDLGIEKAEAVLKDSLTDKDRNTLFSEFTTKLGARP